MHAIRRILFLILLSLWGVFLLLTMLGGGLGVALAFLLLWNMHPLTSVAVYLSFMAGSVLLFASTLFSYQMVREREGRIFLWLSLLLSAATAGVILFAIISSAPLLATYLQDAF
jgi:hypothetical protein